MEYSRKYAKHIQNIKAMSGKCPNISRKFPENAQKYVPKMEIMEKDGPGQTENPAHGFQK